MNGKVQQLGKLKKILGFLLVFAMGTFNVFANEQEDNLAIEEENQAREEERIAKIQEFIQDIDSRAVTECQIALTPAFDYASETYLEFLNTNFSNKSANSSLLNIGIGRYDEYKVELEDYFTALSVGNNFDSEDLENENEIFAYSECEKLFEHYVEIGRTSLKTHVLSTSSDKKTTIFLEKYQSINSQLSEANQEVGKTYGYFVTFKNKLPFFLQQCIKP